ncbi:kynureninase [Halosegnis rubeus]|jgi:kynureninase|uniref:Kynureninase n=1 Tax=Halosegnis rubeus TaxID=2212850 RepID=A0A5N5UDI9_9EURY|nr:kynureninase [Halosegnis rubeus]KAB7516049.1 kynureninase [Halosegnis rubeus]KAB7516738.1 kynureninase [Halosegnis rubeus]KAB7520131.1 kynureninase [Halosegnis rubeus]
METPSVDIGLDARRETAAAADAADPLASFRERFDVPGTYMDGNSLGALSTDAEASLDRAVEQWREHAVEGWTDAQPDWFRYGERLGGKLAPLVGAREQEVAVCGSTTTNIHTLIATFYDAANGGSAANASNPGTILVNDLDFPTDHYAIRAQLRQRGLDPDDHLTVVESEDGKTIIAAAIERALREHDVDVLFLPSVFYRSGQLLDVERLTDLAHEYGAYAGFDLAHSAGVVPHSLHDHGVDFAVWCHYKYLNGGPGAIAGLFCHESNADLHPALAGWWGHEKQTQFEMHHEFTPAAGAGRFQIGTIPILAAAPLDGALDVTLEAGIDRIREKSVALTDYLIDLVGTLPDSFEVGSPREAARRGGHVAIEHSEAYRLTEALKARDVVVDFRPPNVIRVAPAPLYTGFGDVLDVIETLREVHETRAHEHFDTHSGGVT